MLNDEDCDDMQYGSSFGVPTNSNGSFNFIPMSIWADARIARVDAKGGACKDLTDLLFGPLLLMDDDDCDKQKCSSFCCGTNIDNSKLNLNAVSFGGALHFGGVVVNCGNGKDHTVTLCVKVTIGGAPVLPYLQACLSPGSHGDVTTRQKSTSGVLCLTKCIECNAFDQGLFSVSCKKVQLTDASEFADYTHANGPRHIPSKANTPSSNHRCLASVIPRTKYASGSTQSRENKNPTSKKKRLKQQKCLLSIVPSHSHSIPNLLPDKFYTYDDGGNIGNPRINPPSSGTKPNRILSIRDRHLHVIRDHIPHPDKGLIYRFADKPNDIILVPRT